MLIVNCFFDDTRQPVRRAYKVPQALAPVFLAGAFAPERCEVRIVSELVSGPLEDPALLAWADMLVLTGLTNALDRMRQLTAYARTLNPHVVVVAGGHAVRSFPGYCGRVFDYACAGDADDLLAVAAAVFGPEAAASTATPRYDLAPWIGRIGYAESSRGCNFHCRFCTLTGEARPYQPYALADLERQLLALGRRDFVMFLDNNFVGSNRQNLHARLDLLADLHRAGRFRAWGALVTNDFFLDDRNLERARESGCRALFSGVESFDRQWLLRMDKPQNVRNDPVETIRKTLAAGIMFSYGLVLDVANRRIAELRDELDHLLDTPDITLPAYVCVSIPLPGTPFFTDCLEAGRLLPLTRVRDLDGTTLTVQPLDPLPQVAGFVREVSCMEGYRARVARHVAAFTWRHRRRLSLPQLAIAAMHGALLALPDRASAPGGRRRAPRRRTHVSTTDILDPAYQPTLPVHPNHRHMFEPLMITDAGGALAEEVAADLTRRTAAAHT